MLVTLYPGANRDDVLRTLREIASAAQIAGNTHGPAYDRLTAYLEWATTSVQMLEHRVSAADIDRLVLTCGYERLLSVAGSLTGLDVGTQRVLNGLLSLEIQQRIGALEQAVADLRAQIQRWSGYPVSAVADTSFYIENDAKLRDTDFVSLMNDFPDKNVRVIVPLIILDELDGLKRGGDAQRRWRAAYTLAVMEEAFASTPVPGLLQPPPGRTRGGVILDVLFDPPGHTRLPINDDEIIDRALAAQALAGTAVTLLTFDTSQAARARHAGLPVNKLSKPVGEQPQNTTTRKAKQAPAGNETQSLPSADKPNDLGCWPIAYAGSAVTRHYQGRQRITTPQVTSERRATSNDTCSAVMISCGGTPRLDT
jgi:hypothetical protein